jgi:hypothetical protein
LTRWGRNAGLALKELVDEGTGEQQLFLCGTDSPEFLVLDQFSDGFDGDAEELGNVRLCQEARLMTVSFRRRRGVIARLRGFLALSSTVTDVWAAVRAS